MTADEEFTKGLSEEQIWDRPLDRKRTIEAIDEAWANKDSEQMRLLFSDLTLEQMNDIWYVFREFSKKRSDIKQMLEVNHG